MKTITKTKTRVGVAVAISSTVILAIFLILGIEFTSQAPEKNWRQPWQDACEETSIVIVDNFYNKKSLNTKTAKSEILKIFYIKEKVFGPSLDEDAEKMNYIINNFLNWEGRVVENLTLEQIKEEITNNRPVILPADGKILKNKYFNTSGYHVFVISGYDDDKKMFITQEPGTRFGKNYLYSYDTVERAMRDYHVQGLNQGKRVAIFTSPTNQISLSTDGDKDRLNKGEELSRRTGLISADSDGDGYSDCRYSVIKSGSNNPVNNLSEGSLIKLDWDFRIYLIQNNQKRHITNKEVLDKMGRSLNEVKVIYAQYFDSLATASPISQWPE